MEEKKNILIVEDTTIDRVLAHHALADEYNLIEARNGREAMEILLNTPVDLIVSDLLMPEMSGKDLLEWLHSRDKLREIPVLVSTSYDSAEDEKECLDRGCWDFIRKPYDPVILQMRVRNNLERKELYQMKQQHLVNTFQHYIDPAIVNVILADDTLSRLDGRNADVSVLFADIRNFTSLSEKLKPNQLVSLLNQCLTITSNCVKRYNGILDKFIGDCTMAFWGAPAPCENSARQACLAALDMVKETGALLHEYSVSYGVQLSLGVGVHTGPATVGNVGSIDRMDYTVIGDTVNTASRLEGIAPGGKVYISRGTADAIGEGVVATALSGGLLLKGKERPLEVLSLMSITSDD